MIGDSGRAGSAEFSSLSVELCNAKYSEAC